MTSGMNVREQRLRKQAELQSLTSQLVTLREQEVSYISAQAVIPVRLTQQINKMRQQIEAVEDELLALEEDNVVIPAHQFYREAVAAELAEDYDRALKLYRSAVRHSHADASPASRSLTYRLKTSKSKTAAWGLISSKQPKTRFPWAAIATLLIFVLIFTLLLTNYFLPQATDDTIAVVSPAAITATTAPTRTPLPPTVIVPATATLTPTGTSLGLNPTSEILPSPTPTAVQSPTPTVTPMQSVALRTAPQVIGPKDGLVWADGAIVFEFEDMTLRDDELYCLDTLRGYDDTLTENWSYPPIGKKQRSIPIEVNVFRVARMQGIQCIAWSAFIGQGTCENAVSQHTDTFVIGLPRPCVLDE